jgi:DNA polymerase V
MPAGSGEQKEAVPCGRSNRRYGNDRVGSSYKYCDTIKKYKAMYALVDCNNFYVSCERHFDPSLNGKPVIVLSNNDGCAISRSDEAKALGIEMGAVPHLTPAITNNKAVKMFSSNYTLYGDMSDRVMKTLASFVPRMEVYSIDEAFLDLSSMPYTDLLRLGMTIRKTILQNTGIPTCVGIAPTKALAKMANRYAKKNYKSVGVFWAANQTLINEMLEFTEVENVWGIGRQYALMLRRNNILTARQFVQAPPDFIRGKMSVVGLRLHNELNGIPSIAWDFEPPAKKNIGTGRSFGALTSDKKLVQEAMSNFAANCALKLRKQKSAAKEIRVFINTNAHRPQDKQYFMSLKIKMDPATNDSSSIIKYALKGLDIIFKPGYNYMKCGVELNDLVPENEVQVTLFAKLVPSNKKINSTIDKVNNALGKDIVRFGVQGFERKFKARAAHFSRRFTTRIDEVIKIKN